MPFFSRFLRRTVFDPFGYSHDRRLERTLIVQDQEDIAELFNYANGLNMDIAVALAELPLQIRGFGPVKLANHAKAMVRREELLQALRNSDAQHGVAAQ